MIEQARAIKAQIETKSQAEYQLPASILELLEAGAKKFPSELAIRYFFEAKNIPKETHISFDALLSGIIQTANLLHGLGLTPSDSIAIILPRIPEASIALLGSSLVGKVYCVEPNLTADQINYLLKKVNPKVLICPTPFPNLNIWELMEEVRPNLPDLRFILQTDLTDYLGKFKKMTVRMSLRNQGKAEKVPGQQLGDFNRSKEKMPGDSLNFEYVPRKTLGFFHSSGQTSALEFKEIYQDEIIFAAWAYAQYFQGYSFFQDQSPTLPSALTTGILASCFSGAPTIFGGFMGESHEELRDLNSSMDKYYSAHCISHQDGDLTPLYEGNHPAVLGFQNDNEPILLPYQSRDLITPETEYQIPFALIEDLFRSHPSVDEAWIVPQPDIKGHWVPIAYLSLPFGSQPDLKAIYDFVVEKLDAQITPPQGIRVIQNIPKTPLGTPRLYPLIQDEIRHAIIREMENIGIEKPNVEIISIKSGIQPWETTIALNSSLSESLDKISKHLSSFPLTISFKK
jgi:hypothetical protein